MRWQSTGLVMALLLGLSRPVWAAPAVPTIQAMRVDPLTNRLVVTTSGDIEPLITHLTDPPRIVVDLPAQVGDVPHQLTGWLPALKGVRLAQFLPDRGRLVFDIEAPMTLEIERQTTAEGMSHLLFRLVADVVGDNVLQAIDVGEQSLQVTASQPMQPLISQSGTRATIQIPNLGVASMPNLPLASNLFAHLSASMVGDSLVLTATLSRPDPLALALSENGRVMTVRPRSPLARLEFQTKNSPTEGLVMIRGDRHFAYQVDRMDNKVVLTTSGTLADDMKQSLSDGLLGGIAVSAGETAGTTVIALETVKQAAYAVGLSEDGRTLAITLKRESVRLEVPSRRQDAPLIVLDPGHGGNDPGAIGPGGSREAHVTLGVIQALDDELQRLGWRTKLARVDDREILLGPRVAVANANSADLFVSVHCNSLDRPWIKGIETYYRNPHSVPLARRLHAALVGNLGSPDRGVRYANFYVIHHTKMPAVLCEIGYISNPDEEKKLADPAYQRAVAKALAEGLKAYWVERRAK